ncbi:hypothetical protein CENSYa_1033 [Cenarchaeum symbiosum A]|uniref:Uncharacterized protein n=1 Tax=Cenarchaeum symbiosum (strain A) TaxID=414004 RepID=A0RWE7_CENSY|nr:hypothetical protein CENSYa_1033 [Cenarchaeum symbiosum A]
MRVYLAAAAVLAAAALPIYGVQEAAAEAQDISAGALAPWDPAAPPESETQEEQLELARRRIDLVPSEGYTQIREGLVEDAMLAHSGGFFTPEVMKEKYPRIMSVLPGAFMEVDTVMHEKYAQHSAGRMSDGSIEWTISTGISKLEFLASVFNTQRQPGVLESPTKMMHEYAEMTVDSHGRFLEKLGNATDADREGISQVRWTGIVLNYFINKEVRAWNSGEAIPPAAWMERHEQYIAYVAEKIGPWNERLSDSIDEYNEGNHSRYRIGTKTSVQQMEDVYKASAAAAVPEHAAPSWERFRNAAGQLIERNKEIGIWVISGNETALMQAEEITRELVRGGHEKYWSVPLPIPKHPLGEPHVVGRDTVIRLLEDSHSTDHELCERCFDKPSVVVERGLNITWSNDSPVMHGFASGTPVGGEDGTFFTGVIKPGETYSLDTSGLDAGHYGYYCVWHPWETGSFEVREP